MNKRKCHFYGKVGMCVHIIINESELPYIPHESSLFSSSSSTSSLNQAFYIIKTL